jgi:hypothetical protein
MRELREPPRGLSLSPFTVPCRSCVHSPLTLPAGTLARRLFVAAGAAVRYSWSSLVSIADGKKCFALQFLRDSGDKGEDGATFLTPTRLARDPPGVAFSLEGALCRLSLEKIFSARASCFLRSRAGEVNRVSHTGPADGNSTKKLGSRGGCTVLDDGVELFRNWSHVDDPFQD